MNLFKASDPPTFGDTVWKLILRIVAGFLLLCIAPYVVVVTFMVAMKLIELPFRLYWGV